jgi:hypothetical protein
MVVGGEGRTGLKGLRSPGKRAREMLSLSPGNVRGINEGSQHNQRDIHDASRKQTSSTVGGHSEAYRWPEAISPIRPTHRFG